MKLQTLIIENIISEYSELVLERAENDFNRIASRLSNKLFILTGHPRSGKSTVVTNYIRPRSKNLKIVNPDDISTMFTKDPNVHKRGATHLSIKSSTNFFAKARKDKADFLYDSTGTDTSRMKTISDKGSSNGYNIIVISVFAPLKTALDRNAKADRQVDQDYLISAWKESQSNIRKVWNAIKPKFHFIVVNTNERTTWYKFNGKEIVRK
jgi:predicted kinase